MKILVMGLPQSGKTTLCKALAPRLDAVHFENNAVRGLFQDWDFSPQGRIRQAHRMAELCGSVDYKPHVLGDFICPTEATRHIFNAEFTIWMNTVPRENSPYSDTNIMFQEPGDVDFVVTDWHGDHVGAIVERIASANRPSKQATALLIGRFQPFHDGHLALVAKALERRDRVLIGVRDTYHNDDETNPFTYDEVFGRIEEVLGKRFPGRYQIIRLPNITDVFYGRGVGYNIERLNLPEEVEAISASEIRNTTD